MDYLDDLVQVDMVGGDSVGFAGESSGFYVIYEKLKNLGSEAEFVGLLDHENPIVRAMGVVLLSPNKNYHDILKRLNFDSNEISFMPTGCRLFSITLGEFVTNSLINPGYFKSGSKDPKA